MVIAHEPLVERMRKSHVHDPDEARAKGIITQREAEKVHAMNEAVAVVIAVDDFAPENLAPKQDAPQGDRSSTSPISLTSRAAR